MGADAIQLRYNLRSWASATSAHPPAHWPTCRPPARPTGADRANHLQNYSQLYIPEETTTQKYEEPKGPNIDIDYIHTYIHIQICMAGCLWVTCDIYIYTHKYM